MVAAALLCSTASAQVGAEVVKTAARTWTEAEVLQLAGLQPVQKAISWGRVVRYGGVLVTAGSVIYAALEWFYDQAQQATGTELDEWYQGLGAAAPMPEYLYQGTSQGVPYPPSNSTEIADWSEVHCGRRYGMAVVVDGWTHQFTRANGSWRITSSQGIVTQGSVQVQGSGNIYDLLWPHLLDALTSAWQEFTASNCNIQAQPELDEFLMQNPNAMTALRTQVVPAFVDSGVQSGSWPYTYGEPWGPDVGISLDPAPNRNQWYDNPFANPSLDTDGDGFTDAEEAAAGTDPSDPDEYPTVSPWPEPGPGEEPWPDADGDGVPDQFDPCPFDAQNRCVDSGTEPDFELPDDYAREPTQQRVATAVEGILDVLREDPGVTPTFTPLAAPEPADMSPLASWVPDLSEAEAAWASYMADVQADFADLLARTQTAFPFGMGAVLGDVPTFSGSECVSFDFSLMNDETAPVNLCSVPALDQFLATTGRSVLAAVLLLAFIWTSVQTVLRS